MFLRLSIHSSGPSIVIFFMECLRSTNLYARLTCCAPQPHLNNPRMVLDERRIVSLPAGRGALVLLRDVLDRLHELADVLEGPVQSQEVPRSARVVLALCHDHLLTHLEGGREINENPK